MVQMIASLSLIVNAPWHSPTRAEALEGKATFYNPGVMEAVAANRGLIHAPGEYAGWLAEAGFRGTVALNPAGDLMRVVWLEGPQGIEGPFLSIDCAQEGHYADRLALERVVEVDWATAERWGMEGPVPVTVWFRNPQIDSVGKVLEEEYHENDDLAAIGAY